MNSTDYKFLKNYKYLNYISNLNICFRLIWSEFLFFQKVQISNTLKPYI
jgi:hypothetical protein